jgi:predicted metal-dependent hydrolase
MKLLDKNFKYSIKVRRRGGMVRVYLVKELLRTKLGSAKDYVALKDSALRLAKERVSYFNKIYKFEYGAVKIRDQRSRWGSCSRKGNLTFNYRIALLAPELVDYIIVHELCHVREFNHSRSFWSLVELTVPNYAQLKKELNKYRLK